MAKRATSPRVAKVTHPVIRVAQRKLNFFLLKMRAEDLVTISYVAARGDSDEAGAVQRILNLRRISSIRDYTLKVGNYPSSIILNWMSTRHELVQEQDQIGIPVVERSAQIIDGQHRVEGIRAAIEMDSSLGNLELPVALYEHLGTRECADIFLAINTEQKPVPKSLVYDLYGLASEYIVDFEANRAKDIATTLNEEDDSPYYGLIKFPGPGRKRGGIALSTVVSAIKPLVAQKGTFEQAGIKRLDTQTKVLKNYFDALRDAYGDHWEDRENAFIYAAGFAGAIDFLKSRLFEYCVRKRSFTSKSILHVLVLEQGDLIMQSELKGLGGTKARQRVAERLLGAFSPSDNDEKAEFEI